MKNKSYVGFLSGTTLKIIALISMTIDHAGYILFDDIKVMRIIGRLAFPIFAFMLAEGCKYTKNRLRYFLTIFVPGIICQAAYSFVKGSLYLNILITLSLSILLVYSSDFARKKQKTFYSLLPVGIILSLCLINSTLSQVLPKSYGFGFDYGIPGIVFPLLISLSDNKYLKLTLTTVGLIGVAYYLGGIQWWSLISLVPLFFYNGKTGKYRLKYLFYLYYPLHLAVLNIISSIAK